MRNIVRKDKVNQSIWESQYRSTGENVVYYKTLEEAQRLQENAAQNGVKFDIEPNPYYRGNAQYQDKQRFGEGRHKLPVENGRPLLTLPGNRPKTLRDLTVENPSFVVFLKTVYDNLPDSVEDPRRKTVNLKMREGDDNRLVHYITEASKIIATTSEERPKREVIKYEKIPWLPRVAETIQKAQVILQDNEGDHNLAYVRRYPEGWHVVITTPKGVFVGHREYGAAAITQFAEKKETTRRDNFAVIYKRRPWFQGAHNTTTATPDAWLSSADGSAPSCGSPSAYGNDNIYPSLGLVKSLYEKNDEISHRGVTWQDPKSLKTIITLFEKADSSTLIHEIGHYCFNTMEESIRQGLADQQMIDDFNALKKWAESDPKTAVEAAIKQMQGNAKYKSFLDRYAKDPEKVKAELIGLVAAMNNGNVPTSTDRGTQFVPDRPPLFTLFCSDRADKGAGYLRPTMRYCKFLRTPYHSWGQRNLHRVGPVVSAHKCW